MARVAAVLSKDPRLDALAAWPFPDSTHYFMSGSNEAPEIQALSERGANIGVAVPELGEASMRALESVAGGHSRVFVDSGAFSEVAFTSRGPTWPKPITDEEWRKRLDKYVRLARALGRQAFLVAPDRIADQVGTLQRLVQYSAEMAWCARHGAQLLVPVQKGASSMADMYRAQAHVLNTIGVHPESYYPAIPLKKDATSIADLVDFVMSGACWKAYRQRIHFLGRGVFSPDYRDTFTAVMKVCPDMIITSDSVHSRSSGFLGSRAKPGPYMQAMDMLRSMGAPPFEVKRVGLHLALDQEETARLLESIQAGWYDSELFSSADEHLAWLSAGRPEPDEWNRIWADRYYVGR